VDERSEVAAARERHDHCQAGNEEKPACVAVLSEALES
jgi:hypothetical protein